VYETRGQPLVAGRVFVRRIAGHAAVAVALAAVSLAIGMAGYMCFEAFPALDAFLEAAMLLGGMGPIKAPVTEAGKRFAGLFALYAGLVFIAMSALLLGPVVHRLLHRFHLDKA
jgi:hypothetical protein